MNYFQTKEISMKTKNYQFYSNKKCEFYPCHKGEKEINCLFCFVHYTISKIVVETIKL